MSRIKWLCLLMFFFPAPARAGWGNGGCAAPETPAVAGPVWQWRIVDAEEYALYRNSVQYGNLRLTDGAFIRMLSPEVWRHEECPVEPTPAMKEQLKRQAKSDECGCCDGCTCEEGACPCKLGKEPCHPDCKCLLAKEAKPAVDSAAFPGIVLAEMGKHGERHLLNGHEVTRREIVQALTATVPDDRKALSLTVCGGTEEERKAALDAAAQAGLTDKAIFQSYDAANPLVSKAGFVTSGHPSVYLQSPDGLVLCRADKGDLATMESIRAKAASYDPTKDPTPGGLSLPSLADLEKYLMAVPGWVWFAGVFAALLLWHNKGVQK